MISADEAIKIILESSPPCGVEEIALQKALGRYLGQSLTAPIDLPSFDHSAMDGYAVRSDDTKGASQDHPVSLKVVGTIAAGDEVGARCGVPLASGSAYRIMTGAPIPDGADGVIPFEETVTLSPTLSHQGRGSNYDPLPFEEINPPPPPFDKGGKGGFSEIQFTHPIKTGYNIRRAGEDVRCGDVVLEKGTKIHSRNLALLAALGIDQIPVSRTPRVVVVSTGNELAPPGKPLAKGKVHNSNGPALVAALAEIGISENPPFPPLSKGGGGGFVSSSDDERALLSVLKEALSADVVITIGGVSAGDFDRVPKVLSDLGAKILFHKVAIKPGKPFLFATPPAIFGLPGNPVSALTVFDRFVRPALLKMMGAGHLFRPRIMATAAEKLSGSAGKEDYLRVVVNHDKNACVVRSAGRQSAANLLGLSRANAYALIPAEQTAIEAGGEVEVEFFGETP